MQHDSSYIMYHSQLADLEQCCSQQRNYTANLEQKMELLRVSLLQWFREMLLHRGTIQVPGTWHRVTCRNLCPWKILIILLYKSLKIGRYRQMLTDWQQYSAVIKVKVTGYDLQSHYVLWMMCSEWCALNYGLWIMGSENVKGMIKCTIKYYQPQFHDDSKWLKY